MCTTEDGQEEMIRALEDRLQCMQAEMDHFRAHLDATLQEKGVVEADLRDLAEELQRCRRQLRDTEAKRREELAQRDKEMAQLEEALAAKTMEHTTEKAQLLAKVESCMESANATQAALRRAKAEADDERAGADAARAKLTDARRQRLAVERELLEVRTKLRNMMEDRNLGDEKLATMHMRVAKAEDCVAMAEDQRKQLRTEIISLKVERDATARDLKMLATSCSEATERTETLAAKLAKSKEEATRFRVEGRESSQRLRVATQSLEESARQLAETRASEDTLKRTLKETQNRLHQLLRDHGHALLKHVGGMQQGLQTALESQNATLLRQIELASSGHVPGPPLVL
mmetsp:Transcript_8571/g.22107  ORF Transcript_8571/g.22107 Transcript_8571/m.22107 type:complete len:346 (+) Transcript_8571:72-1109(+)